MGLSGRLTAAVRAGWAYSGSSALRMRTAHTLYSGIFEIGSWAAIVTRLMLLAPAQWYGTNTVSGRIVVTTWHRTVSAAAARLDRHPVAVRDPVLAWPGCGCSSSSGSGYWSTSGPMRRVWLPRQEHAHHPAGGQDDRVVGVHVLGRRLVRRPRGSGPCRRGSRTARPPSRPGSTTPARTAAGCRGDRSGCRRGPWPGTARRRPSAPRSSRR